MPHERPVTELLRLLQQCVCCQCHIEFVCVSALLLATQSALALVKDSLQEHTAYNNIRWSVAG